MGGVPCDAGQPAAPAVWAANSCGRHGQQHCCAAGGWQGWVGHHSMLPLQHVRHGLTVCQDAVGALLCWLCMLSSTCTPRPVASHPATDATAPGAASMCHCRLPTPSGIPAAELQQLSSEAIPTTEVLHRLLITLQAADALTRGVLIPRDQAAAFKWYTRASGMGSAAASLKLGIAYFHGTPPAGGRSGREAAGEVVCGSQPLEGFGRGTIWC